MIEQQLLEQIDRVTQRDRRLRLRRGLALGWASVAVMGGALFFLSNQQPWQFALAVPVLCIAAVITWLLTKHRADRACPTTIETARHIEARFPSLSARLLAAVEQVQSAPPQGLGYLQQTVIHQAVEHADQHDWRETVPSLALHRWTLARNVSAFALALVLIGLIIAAEPFADSPQAPTQLVVAPVDAKNNTITVEPGNISIERGSSLIVTARFSQFIPASTALILEGANPALGNAITTRTLPMTASLDDPLVGARVPNVAADLAYRIIGDGVVSQTYRVTVFDFPQLLQADATLRFPDYTGQSEKVIEDTRQVTAVEGTIVTWSLKLNKPITSATLTAEAGDVVTLTTSAASPTTVQGTMTLSQSQRYELSLIDDAGRRNKHKVEFVVSVLKNRPPDLKLVFPKRDLRVSPIEEALVVAQAWDDFGLKSVGITYSLAGQNVTDTTLVENVAGKSNQEVSQLLSFEAMKAQPDQLLSYHFWADDVGPDGKVRRTFSDMYFAEVRPFEEIFREGEAPPSSEQQQQQQQQQQGQQQQIGEGIKQQREIINATWNLIRRETGALPTPTFAADAQVVREAQEAALQQMTQIKERLSDPQSLAHVEAVEKHMAEAASHLAQAAENNLREALKLALPAEQAAYQALLKLQAREHEVIRAQQQQRGQQSGQRQAGPSQQQLNELDLKNQENRYETQRMAQEPQEDPAQRETRQALNRLRDLAKRQQDLNEKLKELDLAMLEAKSQQEREELAQQLKRLREQQEEMLRDVDELRNRMEQANQQQEQRQQQGENSKQAEQKQQNQQNQQAQNQQKQNERQQEAQDAKQQVDEVRQNVRQAAEALEQGLTSKALTEGTRAERKLEELRDEFRRKASGQFAEEVKEIRQDARELAQKQEDLGKKMEEADKAGPRSLRDKGERKELADALGDQKKKLEGLTDKMRKVTEDAEASQPLLSKKLYETLRNADQQQVDRALDVARELLDKGFNNEAAVVEPQARKGINDLKKGVEKAAENVLGDETESMRRARETLDDLAKEVERERGEEPGDAPGQQAMADAKSNREPSEGREPTKQGKGNSEKQPGPNDKAGGQPSQQKSDQPGKSGEEKSGEQPGQGTGEKSGEKSGENAQAKSGDQSGDKSGKQNGKQNGKQPSAQPGQKGEGKGGEKGEGQGEGKSEPSGEKASEQPGDGNGESQGGGKSGESQPNGNAQRPTKGNPSLLDQVRQGGATGGGSGPHGPITGEDFREWSDRLRDVEELIDDPNLREEVARIRDRAQAMRAEFKRHSKEPKWDDVRKLIAQPLTDLRDRLDDELARRDQKRDLVPIDRDPVPGQFTDIVRQYYEKLGEGEQPAEPATKQP